MLDALLWRVGDKDDADAALADVTHPPPNLPLEGGGVFR
jgi:hypothetical protein